ncbi:helix-turn-helix domain-containing protein [Lutimonas sp.]|uniref:helix-turn-helix domain-containing protein n=1 Tax=Lutimonas sp. TaxID=1872403 RepID=UPI003D9B75B3
MAIQDIHTHEFKGIFSLQEVVFDKACVVHESEQIEDYSIFYIKEGKGSYQIDFKSYSFDGNVLFFLSPGQVFSVDTEKIKKAYRIRFVRDFYCIQTHDKEVSCNGVLFNNVYETPFVHPNLSELSKLDHIITELSEEFKLGETAQYDMLQSYLKQFIVLSVRIKKGTKPVVAEKSTPLFKDFSTLVDVHFKKQHAIGFYADRLGVSPKSLSKHFLRVGLLKPSEYLKNRIILEAKRKLLYADSSIKNIAYDLGFNDPAYFTRFFTKASGQSPKKYKASF